MADLLAAGKTLVDQFIAKLPEELRGSAAEMFGKPEAQEAIKFAGESALMRSDYSRNMDSVAQEKARIANEEARVRNWHAELETWHKGVKDLAVIGEQAKAAGWTAEDPSPTLQTPKAADIPADVVRAGDLDAREQLAVKYMNVSNRLGIRHFREFGEDLDMDELINDPRVKTLGIQGVYDVKFKDRYDEKAKLSRDADRAKFEAEIRADERKRLANRPLTPVPGGETSPLDALDSSTKPGTVSADDMAAEYERLVAARAG